MPTASHAVPGKAIQAGIAASPDVACGPSILVSRAIRGLCGVSREFH